MKQRLDESDDARMGTAHRFCNFARLTIRQPTLPFALHQRLSPMQFLARRAAALGHDLTWLSCATDRLEGMACVNAPRQCVIRAMIVVCLSLATTATPAAAGSGQSVKLRVYHFVDYSRSAHYRDGVTLPRSLVTYVRVPSGAKTRLPLVVFAHGFDTTPGIYAHLLDAWSHAGYVVAAPVFPVESANARGGADELDLINEPTDISFVISQLLTRLNGVVNPDQVAVAGQSDGAEAALAAAYDERFADRRIDAAVILSGSELGGRTTWFPAGSPPLLAVQGTRDAINPPHYTTQFFRAARAPKFLLRLIGAGHLPPYTTNARQLAIVEHITIAFLNHYLRSGTLEDLLRSGRHEQGARLTSDP